MTSGTLPVVDDRLAEIVDVLAETQWAVALLDADDVLVWLSEDFKYFVREHDDERLGIGGHFIAALASDTWRAAVTEKSQLGMFHRMMPYLIDSYRAAPEPIELPPPFDELIPLVEAEPRPDVWTGTFEYAREDLPPYDVRFLELRLREPSGEPLATLVMTFMGQSASLLAQLAGGDFAMHARMAELADPGRHAAAVVFVDLQGSSALSRRLPTAAYFDVIRRISTEFDRLTANGAGLVGKHVGDGMTAFFLAEHCGDPAAAAACALRTVRALQDKVCAIAEELDTGELRLNAGLHWGPGLYLGQLVPGGRLEITAIGDEVNQAARIQECARDGSVLASKAFVELLARDDLGELGVDPMPRYEQLQDLLTATPKAKADAGQIAVTCL